MYATTQTQMPDERKKSAFQNKQTCPPTPPNKNLRARARETRVPSCVLFFLEAIQLPSA